MGKLLVGLRTLSDLILTKDNQATFNMVYWIAIALTLMVVLAFVEVIVFARR